MCVYVISAFPGMGKSHAYRELTKKGYLVSDSDSSNFNKLEFPGNYIQHIKDKILEYSNIDDKPKFIFVSSHKEVRDAMLEAGIKFMLLYPSVESKEEMLQRYADRGSPEEFITLLDKMFETWVNEIDQDDTLEFKYKLDGKFILDVVEQYFIKDYLKSKVGLGLTKSVVEVFD